MLQIAICDNESTYPVLQALTTRTLTPYNSLYSYIATPNDSQTFSLQSEFGLEGSADHLNSITTSSDHPLALSLYTQHPLAVTDGFNPKSREKMTLFLPIFGSNVSPRVLVIGFKEPFLMDSASQLFFNLVAKSLVIHYQRRLDADQPMIDRRRVVETKINLVDVNLSERQVKIAKLIAEGVSNRLIAKSLGFSEATIRYETVKLYERMRVKNRAQASSRIRELLGK